MQKHIVWLWTIGFFGLVGAANAQTPLPPAVSTQFDGTYAFVVGTKLNETFITTATNRMLRCPDLPPIGPLTILNGRARYNRQEGTVGPQGELAVRLAAHPLSKTLGVEIITSGRIDGNGTVRARRMGYYCSFDLLWQKDPSKRVSREE